MACGLPGLWGAAVGGRVNTRMRREGERGYEGVLAIFKVTRQGLESIGMCEMELCMEFTAKRFLCK
jgi:hypothetical protein